MRIRARLDVAITQQFVAHLLDLPIPFFAQRSAADLMSRVQANKTIRDVLADQSIGLLADGAMLVAYFGLMFAFDPGLQLVVVGAAVLYVVIFLLGRPLVRVGTDEVQRKEVLASSALLQILRGITTIKSAGAERSSHRRWLNAWIASLNANSRVAMKQQTVSTLLYAIQAAVPIVVLLAGGRRVLDDELTPGRLIGFQMLQAGFLGPLQSVIGTLLRLQIVPVLLGRMDDVFLSEREPARELKCPRLRGDIELKNVDFRYSPTSPPVLVDVSMRIERGKKVALVGPSGSGKSTLARLLLSLYAPTSGQVSCWTGTICDAGPASVRRQVRRRPPGDGALRRDGRGQPAPLRSQRAHGARRPSRARRPDPRRHPGLAAGLRDAHLGERRRPLGRTAPAARARARHRPPAAHHDPRRGDERPRRDNGVGHRALPLDARVHARRHRPPPQHRTRRRHDLRLDGGKIVEQGGTTTWSPRGACTRGYSRGSVRSSSHSLPPPERQPMKRDDLARCEAFGSWSHEERGELADQLQRADFAAGTRVVEQDAPAPGLYLIQEGTVSIELAEPGLAAWTVAELGPGAIFGEIGLLDGSPGSASVVARSDVRLLHLPYARFQQLLHRGDVLALAPRSRSAPSWPSARAAPSAGAPRCRCPRLAAPAIAPKNRAAPKARGELPLRATLLGAPLDPEELDGLGALGSAPGRTRQRAALRKGAAGRHALPARSPGTSVTPTASEGRSGSSTPARCSGRRASSTRAPRHVGDRRWTTSSPWPPAGSAGRVASVGAARRAQAPVAHHRGAGAAIPPRELPPARGGSAEAGRARARPRRARAGARSGA